MVRSAQHLATNVLSGVHVAEKGWQRSRRRGVRRSYALAVVYPRRGQFGGGAFMDESTSPTDADLP